MLRPFEDPLSEIDGTLTDSQIAFRDRLSRVTKLCVDVVSWCDHASINLARQGRVATVAAADTLAVAADIAQFEAHEGPCLAAAATGELVSINDMSTDSRFPFFETATLEMGLHAVLSVPLHIDDYTGSLNLYSDQPTEFDDKSRAFATHIGQTIERAMQSAGDVDTLWRHARLHRLTSPTAVIVDDAQEIRTLLRTMMQLDGTYDVVGEAMDGRAAIPLVGELQPDVIVLDLEMPQMTGWEALPQLHATAPDAKIIIFSSYDDIDEDEMRELGATAIVPKSAGGAVMNFIKEAATARTVND